MATTSKELLGCTGEKPSIIESLLKNKDSSRGINLQEKPVMTAVPTSQFLGKARDFLAVMAKANEKLEQDAQESSRSKYDIEVIDGSEQEHIEMELLLGVTDLQTPEAVAAAETRMRGIQPSKTFSDSDNSDSSSDSECDSDDDNDGGVGEEMKLQKSNSDELSTKNRAKKRPKIIELN